MKPMHCDRCGKLLTASTSKVFATFKYKHYHKTFFFCWGTGKRSCIRKFSKAWQKVLMQLLPIELPTPSRN